jgi:hypothetical protein
MDSLEHVLVNAKKIRALKPVLESMQLSSTLKRNWSSIFGALAKDLQFSHVKYGVLNISSSNFLWVNEIDYYKKDLLAKCQRLGIKLKDIRVVHSSRAFPSSSIKNRGNTAGFPKVKVQGRDLETSIKENIETRIKSGEQLCKKCGDIWTKQDFCSFCRCK